MRTLVEMLESRRLLAAALPTSIFAQPDDTYTLTITGGGTANSPSLASTPITSVAWGVSNGGSDGTPPAQGAPDKFVVTLPSGAASTTFFRYFVTGSNATLVRIDQRDKTSRLRTRWDITGVVSVGGGTIGSVTSFTQSLGAGGVTYDKVQFIVPRMANTYNVPNPGGPPDPIATITDIDFVSHAQHSNPALSANKYMSTSTDFPATIEFGVGQLPLTSYVFSPEVNGPLGIQYGALDFAAVASVDGVPLWGKTAIPLNFTEQRFLTIQRDSLARPANRVQMGGTGRMSNVAKYSFYDTTLDAVPRVETYRITVDAAQITDYSYNAGTGAMNTPLDSFAWNWVNNTSAYTPSTNTAFIKPPTFGVRNTPLASIDIQFSEATPGLTKSDFRFENLGSTNLTLTTTDNLTWTLAGNLAAQQNADGDYAVKLFALGAGVTIRGSTGIKWTLDTTAPRLLDRSFEYETGHGVTFHFSESVNPSFSPADLTLTNLTNNTVIPAGAMAIAFDGSTAHLGFPGLANGILPDGNYRATLNSAGVTDVAGNTLASSDLLDFFVLAGDANRDRVVNFDDLLILVQNYGQTGRTFSRGNFDYSAEGRVDFSDLLLLAQRYETSLVSQAAKATVSPRTRRGSIRDDLLQ